MDELLREAFRHNVWANQQLIAFCRDLPSEQLAAATTGTFGSVLETLNHIVASDAGYLPRLKVNRPDWAGNDSEIKEVDILRARVDQTAPLWEAYLADPLDANHPVA
jgi:uncharacterized damage-inducible protein DinB